MTIRIPAPARRRQSVPRHRARVTADEPPSSRSAAPSRPGGAGASASHGDVDAASERNECRARRAQAPPTLDCRANHANGTNVPPRRHTRRRSHAPTSAPSPIPAFASRPPMRPSRAPRSDATPSAPIAPRRDAAPLSNGHRTHRGAAGRRAARHDQRAAAQRQRRAQRPMHGPAAPPVHQEPPVRADARAASPVRDRRRRRRRDPGPARSGLGLRRPAEPRGAAPRRPARGTARSATSCRSTRGRRSSSASTRCARSRAADRPVWCNYAPVSGG